jgi:assimilatory nitrate reductase catalytic subunit
MTSPALDPVSKQPELKHAAVKILKAELPWNFLVFGWIDEARALSLQTRLRPEMRRFAYASCTLFGRDRTGVLFRAADDYTAPADLIARIEASFGIEGAAVLRYDDARRGNSRHILVSDGKLGAVALSGDIAAEHWLKDYLQNETPVGALGRMLLMPSAKAPKGFKPRGKVVCNCFNVAESDILDSLAASPARASPEAAMADVTQKLRCGSNCGSCVPELRKIILANNAAPASPALHEG